MGNDWDLLRSTILTVLAVTTTIAAGGIGLMFGSLRTLRDTANDLRDRVADLEKERTEDKAANAELTNENKWLKTSLTGKVEWTVVTDLLAEQDRKQTEHWAIEEQLLHQILTAIREAA